MLDINYDKKYDVLYLGFSNKNQSYGDEVIDDYVVMRDFLSEEITGLTIFKFKEKYRNNKLADELLTLEVYLNPEFMKSLLDSHEYIDESAVKW